MVESSDISVIIPTHNDGELLERCLASVAAQRLPPREVIVVDDGTTSSPSLAGIERAQRRFPAVRVIRQAASGPSAARNRGVAEASGTFIAFVDADDELMPDNLAVKRALFDRGEDVVAAFAGIRLIEPDGRTRHFHFSDYSNSLDSDLVGRVTGVPGVLWAYLFRRDAFEAIGGLDENLRIMEDFDALIRLGRGGGIFVGCKQETYIQHRHRNSLTRGSAMRQFRGAMRFLNKARANGYFSYRELIWRYLVAPYSALRLAVRYRRHL